MIALLFSFYMPPSIAQSRLPVFDPVGGFVFYFVNASCKAKNSSIMRLTDCSVSG